MSTKIPRRDKKEHILRRREIKERNVAREARKETGRALPRLTP
ncbi:MAG: hypothetical protein QM813_17115 [Verrucomicrobiota bacterium]